MQFTSFVTIVLATAISTAAANPIVQRQDSNVTVAVADINAPISAAQVKFAAQAANCDLSECGSIVAKAGCIAGGIALRIPSIVLGCVPDRDNLCGCAGCIDALSNFLVEHDICPA
ncbi:hypothetical protein GTA08_BOTSDO13659 [Neofusicoccum parvum]|uniref:Fungal calcium binding protein domain-containing protein n=1 Tax=Botryosphaeria parva (strain UCR-NP2) TaxID=1287680 RepID=R1H2K1_BOTPV|nr:hypothetical protein UCRNP2_549 [Neofusicoccum parvum UCRNP2]GME43049.1 hypothetical protein GTA08_BOTSDO13659 [Neofusicoccum parvum]